MNLHRFCPAFRVQGVELFACSLLALANQIEWRRHEEVGQDKTRRTKKKRAMEELIMPMCELYNMLLATYKNNQKKNYAWEHFHQTLSPS